MNWSVKPRDSWKGESKFILIRNIESPNLEKTSKIVEYFSSDKTQDRYVTQQIFMEKNPGIPDGESLNTSSPLMKMGQKNWRSMMGRDKMLF